jgi:hypothetical protein
MSLRELLPPTQRRCGYCSELFEPIPRTKDDPDEPRWIGGAARCVRCAYDYDQPDDSDEPNGLYFLPAKYRKALRIRANAQTYIGYFDGAELSPAMRGFKAETMSVRLDAAPHLARRVAYLVGDPWEMTKSGRRKHEPQLSSGFVYPWIFHLPRTTGPGILVRVRLYWPKRQPHVVSWFDLRKRQARWEPRDLDLAVGDERDRIVDLIQRLSGVTEIGRPRGSGKYWTNSDEFEELVGAVLRDLKVRGMSPTKSRVVEMIGCSEATLKRGWKETGYNNWADCVDALTR